MMVMRRKARLSQHLSALSGLFAVVFATCSAMEDDMLQELVPLNKLTSDAEGTFRSRFLENG